MVSWDRAPRAAIVAFKRSHGLKARPWVGPLTWEMLHSENKRAETEIDQGNDLPWMVEGRKVLGLHEVTNNTRLKRWLASDKHALGDPAKLPWCGDFVETCIRLTLPNEPMMNNPYWALNWQNWGHQVEPTYGAVISIKRRGGGHVAFLVGEDETRYYCLGGNQRNTVSIVPMEKSRFTAKSFRWPTTFPQRPTYLPFTRTGQVTNTQEG
jgi:uncharacterized protein (TIGR02594 family)